jgi:dihydroneopterin aldolase
MSTIGIEGMHFYAFHGVYAHEKQTGAHYTVDAYLETDINAAATSDNVSDTINYEKVFALTEQVMNVPTNLIEKVCSDITDAIEQNFKMLSSIKVRVTKHSPPIKGRVDSVFVEKVKVVK